jgi:hypothetical protein
VPFSGNSIHKSRNARLSEVEWESISECRMTGQGGVKSRGHIVTVTERTTQTDILRRRALAFAWDRFPFVVLVLYCFVLLPSADAATYTPKLSQYVHTAWGVQDGSFVSGINSITQSSDGYLWLATQTGLVRFDGMRFVSVGLPGGISARSVWSQEDGSIWVGSIVCRERQG